VSEGGVQEHVASHFVIHVKREIEGDG